MAAVAGDAVDRRRRAVGVRDGDRLRNVGRRQKGSADELRRVAQRNGQLLCAAAEQVDGI